MNPTFRTSCNGSLALLHCFLYQLPDYTAVVHPKEGVDRMWGRRRKSPSSHSHTDGFHMGFWGKAPLNSSTQTTVNSVLLPWHNHWGALPILTIRLLLWGIIGGLYIVLRRAVVLTDQQANNKEKALTRWMSHILGPLWSDKLFACGSTLFVNNVS